MMHMMCMTQRSTKGDQQGHQIHDETDDPESIPWIMEMPTEGDDDVTTKLIGIPF